MRFVVVLALLISSPVHASLDTRLEAHWTSNPICAQPHALRRAIWLRLAGAWVRTEYAKLSTRQQEEWWHFASRYYGCTL